MKNTKNETIRKRSTHGAGGRGKHRARHDRRDAGTGPRCGRVAPYSYQSQRANLGGATLVLMPRYARDAKVICFFRSGQKFKEGYMTVGFNSEANLDERHMWPAAFALKELTAAKEARITRS